MRHSCQQASALCLPPCTMPLTQHDKGFAPTVAWSQVSCESSCLLWRELEWHGQTAPCAVSVNVDRLICHCTILTAALPAEFPKQMSHGQHTSQGPGKLRLQAPMMGKSCALDQNSSRKWYTWWKDLAKAVLSPRPLHISSTLTNRQR